MNQPVYCTICQVPLLAEVCQMHFIGKKHQLAVHQSIVSKRKWAQKVYSTGWSAKMDKEQIKEYLKSFGALENIHIGKDNRFVIANYEDPSVAQNLISMKSRRFLNANIYFRPSDQDKIPQSTNQSGAYETIIPLIKNQLVLENELMILKTLILPPPHALNCYIHLCSDLELCLRQKFPLCEAHPFGSTIIGVAFRDSDVDVHIVVPEQYKTTNGNEPFYVTALNKAAIALRMGGAFTNIETIKRAKTPIIRCVHRGTGIKCDFNFKNRLGVLNSHLLKLFVSTHPVLKDCVLILKLWNKVRLMRDGQNRITSYALIMLFIYYLQQKPFEFSSIQMLQEEVHDMEDGWNAGFMNCVNFNRFALNETSLKELLVKFFQFYANFDYETNIICPYLGRQVPKTDFLVENIDEIPEQFELYKINYKRNPELFEKLIVDTPLCVQDPFEHTRNLTRPISKKLFEQFIEEINKSLEILSQNEVSPLYRLFSDCNKPISMISFSIKMPKRKNLNYLLKDIEGQKNPAEELKESWFASIKEFLMEVFTKVFYFDVQVVQGHCPGGSGSKEEHSEDETTSPKRKCVTLNVQGFYNVWDVRQFVQDEFKFKENSSNFEKQVQLSSYIRNLLLGDIKSPSPLVNFTITVRFSEFNVHFTVKSNTRNDSFNEIDQFASFSECFRKRFPHWVHVATHERNSLEVKEDNWKSVKDEPSVSTQDE